VIGAWTTSDVARVAGGTLVGPGDLGVARVAIDSRECSGGALFVGLKGDKHDGRDFAKDAAARGAVAAVVSAPVPELGAAQIVVADPLAALQRLGAENRRRFAGRVAGVTGSAGKTTTRRLIAAIAGARMPTLEPQKNFNNHIGVPLTLLGVEVSHACAVIELGCSDFGEIALLTRLAAPDVALVTNVGPAHLEKLGDLEGVKRAKGELFAGLAAGATAVVNLDDPRVASMKVAAGRVLTYGAARGADVRLVWRRARGAAGQEIRVEVLGREEAIELRVAGAHNALNAVAAMAAASALGCTADDARRGLGGLAATPGRLYVCEGVRGAVVIDDTYNANPSSVGAALEVLAELAAPGARIAVLADMLELGEASDAAHDGIGGVAARTGLKRLVTLGARGRRIGEAALGAGLDRAAWRHAEGHEEAARFAIEAAAAGDAILVKGSRGMRMENVARAVRGGEA
jgi:UDP-N-acetylmuramoyl-tripeptide--D-alanyl-D-alanine ligase